MASEHAQLWESDAEARLLETRLEGMWNGDYFTRIILPLLRLEAGARVLDVGAGTGALTLLLARLLPQARLVGVDLTAKILDDARAQAKTLGLTNAEFQEGDALTLPFPEASFDAVVCQTLLTHIPDAGRAVAEMARVLRPGGTLMAAEFHILTIDFPIDANGEAISDERAADAARYARMLVQGYRTSGQGDLRVGGRVPFLAAAAGLEVTDVRINDRVAHAFPPYRKPAERAALAEAQSWCALFADPGYRAWLSGAMLAGGGTENDVDGFLDLLSSRHREAFARGERGEYAFVWLINPVLLVTIAHKPARDVGVP